MKLLKCFQFYFKNGRPPPNEMRDQCVFAINQHFYGHMDGLQLQGESTIAVSWIPFVYYRSLYNFFFHHLEVFLLIFSLLYSFVRV